MEIEPANISDMEIEQAGLSEIQILYACRSVMDLKAKGIHFRPSSRSPVDIKFNSYTFYGQLQLPIQVLSDQSSIDLSNMIAYELSPKHKQYYPAVLSYVIFMKSLIQSTEDVKELQEKGILFTRLANLDHVVKVFREIDTFGLIDDADMFQDVRIKIEKHCRKKAKTWIADLIRSRFKSPWTVVAFLAATFSSLPYYAADIFYHSPCKMK